MGILILDYNPHPHLHLRPNNPILIQNLTLNSILILIRMLIFPHNHIVILQTQTIIHSLVHIPILREGPNPYTEPDPHFYPNTHRKLHLDPQTDPHSHS